MMSLHEVLKTALDQIRYISKTETVFGEPIEAGKLILIPVSKVSIGFAAGGANSEKKSGAGTGTGGGVQITPVAFISVSGEQVNLHLLEKSDSGLKKIISKLAPDVLKRVLKFIDERDKKSKKDKKKESEKNK